MMNITLAGRIGGDATHRALDNGDVTSFNMAVDHGFGDKKETYWFSISLWGKRGAALAPHLRKGSSVTVAGEFSTRQHEGKTYLQCRANDITLQGGKPSSEGGSSSYDDRSTGGGQRDLDDDIPF
jgi:single-strand DNA-binding protein